MKLKLRLSKNNTTLHEGVYDISDADTFGAACANLWKQVTENRLLGASNVGALYDVFDEHLVDEMCGATITISRN
jgi:hypothetical protein